MPSVNMKPTYPKGHASRKEGTCTRCHKRIRAIGVHNGPVMLELDQRTGEYHDFGQVPEDDSQGLFEFGQDCAVICRMNAHLAMVELGIPVPPIKASSTEAK